MNKMDKTKFGGIKLISLILSALILIVAVIYFILVVTKGPIQKIDANKEYVYTGAVTDEYYLEGGNPTGYTVRSKVPVINLKSNKIKEINELMQKEIFVKSNENKTDGSYYVESYKYYINNNVLSLAVITKTAFGSKANVYTTSYKTYNIDMKTGKQIPLLDYLKRVKEDKTEIEKGISDQIGVILNDKQSMIAFTSEKGKGKISNDREYFIDEKGVVIIILDMEDRTSGLTEAFEYNTDAQRAIYEGIE